MWNIKLHRYHISWTVSLGQTEGCATVTGFHFYPLSVSKTQRVNRGENKNKCLASHVKTLLKGLCELCLISVCHFKQNNILTVRIVEKRALCRVVFRLASTIWSSRRNMILVLVHPNSKLKFLKAYNSAPFVIQNSVVFYIY